MARPRAEWLGALFAGTLALALPGQAAPVDFVAPDGTRFLLLADSAALQVHWAIASAIDPGNDPPGFEGLAFATLQASLHGSWRTGSRDAEKERAALTRLDDAWQRMIRDPRDQDAANEVRTVDAEARDLADLNAFSRVLASAPAWRPEVQARGPVGVFVLTTMPAAIGDVGRLLVERRDEQPLRELPRTWLQTFRERVRQHLTSNNRALHAEVLALSLPDHPASRAIEPPSAGSPRRDQALAVWAQTQRPDRTVHVLLGNFDPTAVQAELATIFARSTLPMALPPPATAPRPLVGPRRSTVAGINPPTLAMAWLLPPVEDRTALAAGLRWLAAGPDSRLGRELQRAGRGATIRIEAPWPSAVYGWSLLLLEASDPAGTQGLAELLLAACRQAASSQPDDAALQAANVALQRDFAEATHDGRQLAVEIAVAARCWPHEPPRLQWPERIDPAAVQQLLERTFRGHPVIVEGKP